VLFGWELCIRTFPFLISTGTGILLMFELRKASAPVAVSAS